MATIQKTTMKRFNGTDWDPIHLATSGDITQMGETFQVMGEPIGALKVGDTINSTDTVTAIIKKMLQTRIPASYTQPSVSLVASGTTKGGNYEVGTTLNGTLTATFTAGDAGALTNLQIKKGGTAVVEGASTPQTYNVTGVLGEETQTFQATATYEAGAVKDDNLGDPSPDGQIQAGSKNSSNITFTGYRKYFYGADSTGTTAITTSADIRKLTNSNAKASKGTKFSITVPTGSTRCTIAFDKTVGTLAQVLYKEAGNSNITGQFALSEVNVEGADGFTAKAYNVYTILWAQPSVSAMTFDVTI